MQQPKEEQKKINSPSQKEQTKEDNERNSRSRSRSKSREKHEKKEKSVEESQSNISPFPIDEKKIIKAIFWNVAGLRALLPKKDLEKIIKEENPDIICFNETKMDEELIEKLNLKKMFQEKYNFYSYWNC